MIKKDDLVLFLHSFFSAIVLFIISSSSLWAGPDLNLNLTQEEIRWLDEHPRIRVGGPKSFPPFHFYDNQGNLSGISADYLQLIAQKLGISLIIEKAQPWKQVLDKAKKGQLDLIACIAKTDSRRTYLNFSQPYLSFPLVIITKNDSQFIGGIRDLTGKKVTMIRGNMIEEQLTRDGIMYTPHYVDSPLKGLKTVSFGRADVHIENLAAASYMIRKYGLTNLKVAAPTSYENYKLYMAAGNDLPELVGIINKALQSISHEKQAQIRNRWLSIRYEYGINKRQVLEWIVAIVLFSTIVIILIMIWNRRLQKEVRIRKLAEENLKLSESRFREIIEDVSGIAIQGYDEKRRVTFWNRASERLYGYTQQEAHGQKLEDLIIPDDMQDQVKQFHNDWLEKHIKIPAGELMLVDKFGNPVPVFSSHVMHKTHLGREMFCIDVDLKPIKQAQEEKIKAQKIADEQNKMALVGQIAGKMAHDFNNILSIVLGTAELAILDCDENETRESLKLILDQAIRGKNLTRNLAIFAKDHEPRQEYFCVQEKIDLILDLLKKDLNGIELEKKCDPDMPMILADPGMLEHSLINLVQNSIHALSRTKSPVISIKTWFNETDIFIQIEDNGCGIPKEFQDQIYEPSFTLKGSKDLTGAYRPGIKGTGYGMSNVKKSIEQHNGSISLSSGLDRGTRFIMRLPVVKEELTSGEIAELSEGKAYSNKRILLVEDEVSISRIQYQILTHAPCHHKVKIAGDGEKALEFFTRDEFDLVSLDYILPGGLSGMDIYNEIRKTNSSIPVLFISGNIEFLESIKDLKHKDPFIDHQSKPCLNMDYIKRINALLGKVYLQNQSH